ncbi:putative glutathione S-transferase [Phenylobacterium zucineum HLK1]|uniref:Putative glutathione S-transferase n=1 Tax=Phenylobacterium zucineum (strain HLK1) TaxID=450851 RepID=B4RCJ2_PHEZH|nr:glutathione S-transferase family protein [Phenylobacterium zucineum]ACG76591.1 putative glutathione S-transferase [Phenylobacterium zucineum HLK1]
MITLHGRGPGAGLPEASLRAMTSEVLLKIAGVGYRKAAGAVADAPVLEVCGRGFASQAIGGDALVRAFLEQVHGVDFEEGLAARERAGAWMVERMAEDHLRPVAEGAEVERETLVLAVRSLAALAELLGENPYLFGRRPCAADAAVFPVLARLMSPAGHPQLKRRAEAHGGLVAYVDRLMARFYPEFPWLLEAAQAA